MCDPKGSRAILANLKNCNPNGMPIMVMHHTIPTVQDITASSHPKINIQITLSKKLLTLLEKITSLPNGQNTNEANLKHCIPAGIAIMVQQQITPTTPHSTEIISPPNINHSILPKVFMLLLPSSFVVSYISISSSCSRVSSFLTSTMSPISQFNALHTFSIESIDTGSFLPILEIVLLLIPVAFFRSVFFIPLSIRSFHNLL